MSEAPSPASVDGVTVPAPESAPAAAGGADGMAEAEAARVVVAAQVSAGFGRALAAAREAQGVPVAEMAGRLRLHPRQLEALEQERLDELPSALFVRGYVRSYAKELKIDPVPLLAALGTRLPAPATIGLNAPAGLMMTEVRRAGVERASRVMVIGGSVVALLILAIVGWIASTRLKPAALPLQVPQAAPSAAAPVTDPGPATAPAATSSGESPSAAVVQPSTPSPAVESAAATTAVTSAVPAPTSGAPAAASTMASGLRLQVSGKPSWIEVTDADGRVVFVGTLSSGAEQYLGNIKQPLRLTIGNASTVTVTYRGRLVDLQPHIRANDLARLTLE